MSRSPERPSGPIKPGSWFEALNCAIEGILYAARTQRHMRYHFLVAIVALIVSLVLKLPLVEFMLFAMSIIILLAAEMLNTAIEETVNLLEQKYNITAKVAKDVSAGAVLISALALAVMVYVLFSKYLLEPTAIALREARHFSAHIAVIALLMVLIGVIVSKTFFARGRPLQGGLPSGHAAVAFSMWTSVTILTLNPLVSAFTLVLAVMVSHSRVVRGIHTRFEVLLGALLGTGLTLLIYYLFTTFLA